MIDPVDVGHLTRQARWRTPDKQAILMRKIADIISVRRGISPQRELSMFRDMGA